MLGFVIFVSYPKPGLDTLGPLQDKYHPESQTLQCLEKVVTVGVENDFQSVSGHSAKIRYTLIIVFTLK